MKIVAQRVREASVSCDAVRIGAIEQGLLLFVGIGHQDTEAMCVMFADKIATLRIFEDHQGKMNLSLLDINGSVLVVSQFTLYADTSRGRRPSFIGAASPDIAAHLVDHFTGCLREKGLTVATGRFGADMQVSLINDGPVTIILEA